MASRRIGGQIQYALYIEIDKGERNELQMRTLQVRKTFKNDYWIQTIKDHIGKIVKEYKQLKMMPKDELKKKIRD